MTLEQMFGRYNELLKLRATQYGNDSTFGGNTALAQEFAGLMNPLMTSGQFTLDPATNTLVAGGAPLPEIAQSQLTNLQTNPAATSGVSPEFVSQQTQALTNALSPSTASGTGASSLGDALGPATAPSPALTASLPEGASAPQPSADDALKSALAAITGTKTGAVSAPGAAPPPATVGGVPAAGGVPPGTGAPGAPGTPAGGPAQTPQQMTSEAMIQRLIELALQPGGLSPEAIAAMRTQAMEAVPARFEEASRNLSTSLLRRGGNAGLPAGGEFLQTYGPLVAAMEQERAAGLRGVTLADEEARQRAREFGLTTASGLAGQQAGIDIARADIGSRFDLARFDADTRIRLAQMGIDSNEKLAALDASLRRELTQAELTSRMDIATLDSDTRFRLSQMGIDSNEKLFGMDADLRRELTREDIDARTRLAQMDAELRRDLQSQGIDADMSLAQLDSSTRLQIAEIQAKGGSIGSAVIASLLSSLAANPGMIKDAIGVIKDVFTGGGAADAAGAAGGAAALGGFGAKAGAFFTNPITIGIGAAIVAGTVILKSQAHWEANEAVQNFENPFANQFIIPMHTQFFKAAESGQLSPDQAAAARSEFETGWNEYVRKITEWGTGGDKKTVANQSINNLWPLIERIIADMDRVIQTGGYDYAVRAA